MTTISPQATDKLNNPSHSLIHRIITVDSGAAEGSLNVTANGDVNIASGKKYLVNNAEVSGGKSFIFSTIFENIDRLSNTDNLGTSTIGDSGLTQTTTTNNASYSSVAVAIGGAGTGSVNRAGLSFTWQGYLSGNGSDYDAIITLGTPTFNDGGLSAHSAAIGFYIKRRSTGDIELYAHVANDSAETDTLLTTLTIDECLELKLVYNSSSSVDFYYAKNNAALSTATNITTNIPTGLAPRIKIGITNASAGTTAMSLYSGFACVQY